MLKQHPLCFGMGSAADLFPVLYELPTNLDLVITKPQIFPYINIFKINFHIINQINVPMLLKYSALEMNLYYIYMWTSPCFFFLQTLSNRNLPKPYSVILKKIQFWFPSCLWELMMCSHVCGNAHFCDTPNEKSFAALWWDATGLIQPKPSGNMEEIMFSTLLSRGKCFSAYRHSSELFIVTEFFFFHMRAYSL